MNVFVLPSWYPSAASPMAGLFVRDQARAVAQARPDWNVVVGSWGHHDGALALRDVAASARALRWRLGTKAGWRADDATLHEVLTPRLSWSLAVAGGGARGLLQATLANLRAAERRFGRMALLHAHVAYPAGWIAAQIAGKNTGSSVGKGVAPSAPAGARRYVLTEHMSPFPFDALRDRDGQPNAAVRQAFTAASATVAVSRALATAISAAGLPCSDVVPNAVDDSRFPLAPLPAGPGFNFFTLSSLVPRKGVAVLLHALATMRHQQATLDIGGDGPERAALQALADHLGLGRRVRFLGAVPPHQVPARHAASDAFVLASFAETFGVVLVEALMSGRPVIATRCGGPQDIVHAGNGWLVPPNDAAALAAAMDEAVERRGRHDAAALRADAVARFSQAAVGRSLAALYERVVA